ncbi:MAG: hypothetical protein ACE5I0_04065 [Candidatus Binatia bacterium]
MVRISALLRDERGVVMVISLLILALLVGAGVGAIVSTQTDLKTSSNVKVGAQAFYLASAGIERGKQQLVGSGSVSAINENFGAGSYSVTITGLGSGKYRLTSTACLPAGNPCPSGNSKKIIEIIMSSPGFTPSAAISIDGDGTHSDFDDGSGGTGNKIPSFSVDGRNHSADGSSLSSTCANVSPFAGTESGANTDITDAADNLKRRIVQRANSFCPGTDCTDGLNYVEGLGLTDQQNDCPGTQCYENLDLSARELRGATDATPLVDQRGPFTPIDPLPLVKPLTSTEVIQLQQSIADIIELSNSSSASKKNCISADIREGTSTFGTPSDPKITYVLKAPCPSNPTYIAGVQQGADLDIKDGAVVNGAGILIVPKRLRIRDATFNWQGIVLVVEDGDFRADTGGGGSGNTCGAINGALILQDDQGNDTKLDLDKVTDGGCTSPDKPFSINFSCDAVNVSLRSLLKQISWVEKF